uniref:Pleckstrin homology domain-containing family A member 8 n=1 Tax=Tetraodon nigroviridis TaxID=99883 RepID=H3C462_TETNG
MEGMLYKWTNYISGWQPRWFVLEGGTLSYYDSQEDAWKGCKGSIKVSVCEIQVHSTDATRVDLTIPGEQYFYLRAFEPWVFCSGTATKVTNSRREADENQSDQEQKHKTVQSQEEEHCADAVQQHQEPKAAADQPECETCTDSSEPEDTEHVETFFSTMSHRDRFENVLVFSLDHLSQTPCPMFGFVEVFFLWLLVCPILKMLLNHRLISSASSTLRCDENTRAYSCLGDTLPVTVRALSGCKQVSTESPSLSFPLSGVQLHDWIISLENKSGHDTLTSNLLSCLNLFRFSDMRLDDDSGIPTQEFLDSCYAIVPLLDKLGSTVFAPVKMDFVGNIKKIHQKLLSDPDGFPTLQSIVLHEVQNGVALVRNSATEALLWLRRGLKFLKEFLAEVNAGQQDIQGALNNAYGKTLRQYHGWVVRGVFALALRAAPSYQSFSAALVSIEGDELKRGFTRAMHRDLGVYLPAMEQQLAILDHL